LFEEVSFDRLDLVNTTHTLVQDGMLTSDIIIFMKKETVGIPTITEKNVLTLKLHNLFACGKQNLQRQQKMTAIQTRLSYFGKIHSQDIKFLVALKREVPETRILTERITSLEKELKEKRYNNK